MSNPLCNRCGHLKSVHNRGGIGLCLSHGCSCILFVPQTKERTVMLCNKCGHSQVNHYDGSPQSCTIHGCSCRQFVPPGDADVYSMSSPENQQERMSKTEYHQVGPLTPPPQSREVCVDHKYKEITEPIPGIGTSSPENPVETKLLSHDACLKAIEQATEYDSGAIAFLRGRVIEYAWQLGRGEYTAMENPEIEARKLKWYLDRLVSLFKDEEDAHRQSTTEAHQ